ncbi:hypothetical protein Raf01_85900 [Rugosimonospora africana]|uniref:Uncharacterized protein n=1 Tax=Rugosimonospora africana TaxID=556532 RepID=A0A8J3R0U7_9ACTN|nr:hypothetical protein Raf01_85900 [Rugosimonospora africana]
MTTAVLDHTALLAIRRNQNVSRAIATAPETDARLVVPALGLLGAAAHDPPVADHVGSLHRVDVANLGPAAVGFTARLIATESTGGLRMRSRLHGSARCSRRVCW